MATEPYHLEHPSKDVYIELLRANPSPVAAIPTHTAKTELPKRTALGEVVIGGFLRPGLLQISSEEGHIQLDLLLQEIKEKERQQDCLERKLHALEEAHLARYLELEQQTEEKVVQKAEERTRRLAEETANALKQAEIAEHRLKETFQKTEVIRQTKSADKQKIQNLEDKIQQIIRQVNKTEEGKIAIEQEKSLLKVKMNRLFDHVTVREKAHQTQVAQQLHEKELITQQAKEAMDWLEEKNKQLIDLQAEKASVWAEETEGLHRAYQSQLIALQEELEDEREEVVSAQTVITSLKNEVLQQEAFRMESKEFEALANQLYAREAEWQTKETTLRKKDDRLAQAKDLLASERRLRKLLESKLRQALVYADETAASYQKEEQARIGAEAKLTQVIAKASQAVARILTEAS